MKQETIEQTTGFRFEPYEYQVEKDSSGSWRALYRTSLNDSWHPCKQTFDYGWFEVLFIFQCNARKACQKHADKRRYEFVNRNTPAIKLGFL